MRSDWSSLLTRLVWVMPLVPMLQLIEFHLLGEVNEVEIGAVLGQER